MKILIYFDIMIWILIKIISNERLIQSIGKQNRWVSGNRKRDDLVEQESWDGKTKKYEWKFLSILCKSWKISITPFKDEKL